MDIYELVLDEAQIASGINAISLVQKPAIEMDFIALKNHKEAQPVQFKKMNADKRILIGAALIPDKPIYRKEGEEEYYVYFTKDTVRRASQLFMKLSRQNSATVEHALAVDGTTVVESWIVEDPELDKSKKYGFSVPAGTWFVVMKVENEELWQSYIKTGALKGFSIEGFFTARKAKTRKPVKHSQDVAQDIDPDLAEAITIILDLVENATE